MSRKPPAEPMRPRRRVVTPDEARVWRSVTSDVVALPGKMVLEEEAPLPVPVASPFKVEVREPEPDRIPEPIRLPKRELPSLNHGASPGVDRRSADRLKKGEMEIESRLDLHGMTQDAAHGALLSFMNRAYDRGYRCVLVITGKGTKAGSGVLRAQVPRWLNMAPLRERILSFSHAKPHHGGEGALYVLVRRKR